MSVLLLLLCCLLGVLGCTPEPSPAPAPAGCGHAPACTGDYAWARLLGGAQAQAVNDVATDAEGNVYVIGSLAGTMDLGAPTGVLASAGDADVFVARFDPQGALQWANRYGDAALQEGLGVAVDGAGDALITGRFAGSIAFGQDPLPSAGAYDLFVAKLDPAGHEIWSRAYGDAKAQRGEAIAVDARTGDVYVAGQYQGDVVIGGIALPAQMNGQGALLFSLSPAGAPRWARGFSSAGLATQDLHRVAVGPDGSVSLVGQMQNAVDLGGGALASAGGSDVLVARFSAEGDHLWSERFGGAADQVGWGLAVNAAGEALITGRFAGTLDIGGSALVATGAGGVFVARLGSDGHPLASQGHGTDASGWAIAADTSGDLLITGRFQGELDLGGGKLVSQGGDDVFVARLDAGGKPIWARSFGGPDDEVGNGIAVDPSGDVWIGGRAASPTDFGGGMLVPVDEADAFLLKLAP